MIFNMQNYWIQDAYNGCVPDDFHGGVKWQSPSNIALVKYWGKRDVQLPQNPSISFTLKNCRTETSVFFEKSDRFSIAFYFEGKMNALFESKIKDFIKDNIDYFPFLLHTELIIHSHNTFPHSSGIASSASSMSAFVMCLLDMERILKGKDSVSMQKGSYFSRLASGSACRSMIPTAALWGDTEGYPGSSDMYAIPLEKEIAPVFKTFHDSILIVSDAKKEVSSRAGHALMQTNPYAEARYATARKDTAELLQAMKTGDLETFIRITESEAMQLHALMMCSEPPYILMKPNTLAIINAIHDFRKETDIPVCFTLDAGPNVHILYPDEESEIVERFIMDELESYCVGGQWIADQIGNGASKMHE